MLEAIILQAISMRIQRMQNYLGLLRLVLLKSITPLHE